jgi:hypothetical protein
MPRKSTPLVKWVCEDCGSNDCGSDAYSVWDTLTQEEVLGGSYDDAWCTNCGGDAPIKEVPLTRAERAERRLLLEATPAARQRAALLAAAAALERAYDNVRRHPVPIGVLKAMRKARLDARRAARLNP